MDETLPKIFPDKYKFLKVRTGLDLLSLDEELSEISVLVQDACECAAIADEYARTAKEGVAAVSSAISNRLRREVGTVSGKPRSETQIESELPLTDEYQQALATLSEARLDAGLWSSMVEGLKQKGYSINTSGALIANGFLTQNYMLEQRRKDIRGGGQSG